MKGKRPVLFLWAALVLLCSCPLQAQDIGQQFEGFDLQGYGDDGEKEWDLHGESADVVGETIRITQVDANQYGEQPMNLKAQVGIVDKASGDIHLEKDVVITSEQGGQLKTDSLDWKKEQDLVTTEDQVELIDKGILAQGVGMRASPGLKTAQVQRDVTIKVQPEDAASPQDVITVTCDGPMEIDQRLNKAVLKDNVVAVQQDRTLKADEVEIYFDPDTQDVQRMICVGNVELIQGPNRTHSARAVYDAKSQKLILSGSPKILLVPEEDSGGDGFGF